MNNIRIDDCSVLVTIPVQWRDLDALQHVNNAEYVKWFESARIIALQDLGLLDANGGVMSHLSVGPILASISATYLRPVTFPDTVRVGCYPTRVGRSSFDLNYIVWSNEQAAVVAEGHSVIVNYDYKEQKSSPLSHAVVNQLSNALGDFSEPS